MLKDWMYGFLKIYTEYKNFTLYLMWLNGILLKMQMLYYYHLENNNKKRHLKLFPIKSWKITRKKGRGFAKSAAMWKVLVWRLIFEVSDDGLKDTESLKDLTL